MNKESPVKGKREDFDPAINQLADEHDPNHLPPEDYKICGLCIHKKTLAICDTMEKLRKHE